ncbi:Ig-like domain-containing protein [Neotamlana laminarinivorans]|uniref:Ig-like domain-containing protein n=1 Tax=Neotamlana laminarinivorans TaxID=2883124 RepID=A0A9X1HYJ0_9FLAO|nr:Ig-like domain-containing protein [Tamlana laminarinivorans]MCB4798488.1 Ig-like domain-containing protein [Tamlana laminarinivorans]
MNNTLRQLFLTFFIGSFLVSCANRGTPSGGPKDEAPPEIIKSTPKNYTTNFKGNQIEIVFNEYIKINNIDKQLIISPPMKHKPDISPQSSASKKILITIKDTLQPNTTYAFNFGNSIEDYNEGNPFSYYRYVFSTGDYIDSLSVKGKIIDAFNKKPETFVNVGLYEVDSTYTDSIVYNEVPKYITNTLDSLTTFSIENLKAGKYLLVALKDNNSDNKFQQKTDKIGFYKEFITVPNDSSYTIKMFAESVNFKPSRPRLFSGEKIAFGYEGSSKNMKIDLVTETPEDFEYRITKDELTDTLYYWYKPRLEADSLIFKVTNNDYEKEFTARLSEQKRDSLLLKKYPSGEIALDEDFKIFGSVPFYKFDDSKISIMDKDSASVAFKTSFDTLTNIYNIAFDKTYENKYNIEVLPEAFTDFFDNTNDSLKYVVNTKKESDYGYARFTLVNAKFPIILQLTDNKGETKIERFADIDKPIEIYNLTPSKYSIRVIFDANGNRKYDPGVFLKKTQPEEVYYFKEIEVRADWGIEETLTFPE